MLQTLRKARREWAYGKAVYSVLNTLKPLQPDSPITVPDEFEQAVDQHANRPAFIFDVETLTYAAFDARANRIAHWALAQGFAPGEAIALLLENSPDYPAVWFGLAKIGVVTALINTNLEGEALGHCIGIAGCKAVIASGIHAERARSALSNTGRAIKVWDFDGAAGEDLSAAIAQQEADRPDAAIRAHVRGSDTALFIYTSGTTGLPKAAKVTHMRLRSTARFANILGTVGPGDRVYNVLPLYHMTGGCMGTAGPLTYGATIVLRRKLSVSRFWDDVADHQVNKFVYIGELCRYLLNAPPHPKERAHQVRIGFGNGLRGEVWRPFVKRFGIGQMREFYGSTEGNVSFMNLDGKIGAIGRLPGWMEHRMGTRIVKFDLVKEVPVRGPDGFCMDADPDEPGEAIGRIGTSGRQAFSGYHDAKATQKKILTDVFEKGDRWFRTGDLVRRDHDGYVYFVDRIGDTFRWKGENVATNEVCDVVSKYPGVGLANVYGVAVPGADGRAGMVAMTIEKGCDIAGLAAHCAQHLPSYAVPLFIRIQPAASTTGTFKFRKVELVEEGFDIRRVADPVWFLEPGASGYVRMGPAHLEQMLAQQYRL